VEGLTAFDSWLDQFVVKEQAANLLPMAWGAQLLEFGRRESKATVVRSPGRGFAETIDEDVRSRDRSAGQVIGAPCRGIDICGEAVSRQFIASVVNHEVSREFSIRSLTHGIGQGATDIFLRDGGLREPGSQLIAGECDRLADDFL
jgi:hypothetical protein